MAERVVQGQDGYPAPSQSPRPGGTPARPESGHPALRSAMVDIPVTPGIDLGAYDSTPESTASTPAVSFFADELARKDLPGSVGESPPGAESNQDILRRISLSAHPKRQNSLDEIDPRAANPSLGLSGGMISATFCIPHSLRYIKGSEWVRSISDLRVLYANNILGTSTPTWHVCPLRFSHLSLI